MKNDTEIIKNYQCILRLEQFDPLERLNLLHSLCIHYISQYELNENKSDFSHLYTALDFAIEAIKGKVDVEDKNVFIKILNNVTSIFPMMIQIMGH